MSNHSNNKADYYCKIIGFKGIYQVHPKKYIIITTERKKHRVCTEDRDVVAEIDVKKKQTKKMFILEEQSYEYDYKSSPRFMFSQYHRKSRKVDEVFDLYTGFRYKMPDSSVKSKKDIVECYSSKEVIVLQINQGYCLYINGYLVYRYTSEEYESVLYNLRNKITKHSRKLDSFDTEYFFTVIIGKNLCIWKKKEEPEMIAL